MSNLNSDNGNTKTISTKWLDLLYAYFILQCVLLSISSLRSIYYFFKSDYPLVFMLFTVVRLAVKIVACNEKYGVLGYYTLISSLIVDAIYVTADQFFISLYNGIISIVISLVFLILNYIYIKRRKKLFFYPSKYLLESSDASDEKDDLSLKMDCNIPSIETTPTLYSTLKKDDVTQNNQAIKYCRYCGAENNNGASFCRKCGKKIS